MHNFSINAQLTVSDYRKLQFFLLYSKLWVKIFTIVAILWLLIASVLVLVYHYSIWDTEFASIGFAVTVSAAYLPIKIYFSSKKNFNLSLRLQEPISYRISEEGITYTGESFNGTSNWEKVYQLRTVKNWLLIYQNPMIFNMIKVGDEYHSNIQELKQFLQSQYPNVKIKM